MPSDPVIPEPRTFIAYLLDIVFTEIEDTCRYNLTDNITPDHFCYSDYGDLTGISIGTITCVGYPMTNIFNVLGYHHVIKIINIP
jgi:hypothetical protein